jgi:hypothetical protein
MKFIAPTVKFAPDPLGRDLVMATYGIMTAFGETEEQAAFNLKTFLRSRCRHRNLVTDRVMRPRGLAKCKSCGEILHVGPSCY